MFVKIFLSIIMALFLTQCSDVKQSPFQKSWSLYQELFIDNGRIIDTVNKNISHSEGQGYGLLFAVSADDREAFKAIWSWTQHTLQRSDHLFSWKYEPCTSTDQTCITDKNNATDGDILIAWALLIAAEHWGVKEYKTQAISILDAIKSKLIRQQFGYHLLMPANYGFDSINGQIQINLSYWVFPAINTFFDATNDQIWNDVYNSGIRLLKEARFGQWQLPPDWLMISEEGMRLEGALSQDYGYNACRLPIYLMLADVQDKTLISPFLDFWNQSTVPAVVHLDKGTVAEYRYSSGMEAIAVATKHIIDNKVLPTLPAITAQTDYYSASLILLSQLSLLKE